MKHGGKRTNSGRKQKYNEPTELITFRCPESAICELKVIVKQFLKGKEK